MKGFTRNNPYLSFCGLNCKLCPMDKLEMTPEQQLAFDGFIDVMVQIYKMTSDKIHVWTEPGIPFLNALTTVPATGESKGCGYRSAFNLCVTRKLLFGILG